MRVNSILPLYNTHKSINKKQTIVFDTFEKINFKGNIPFEIQKQLPVDLTLDDVIKNSQRKENILGIGANSTVYDIKELDGYVLKVLNKDDPNKIKIGEFPSTINLGQPVYQDEKNPRLMILKKVQGTEHSIPFWSDTIWDKKLKEPKLITKAQSDTYFKSVEKLANMPQSAFDEIAYKVKLLSEKDYKVDSINPNNLIVDDNEIHIIDYFKVKPREKAVYQNSSYDLIAIMLDFTLLPEYFEKMDKSQQEKFIRNAKTIFEKVQTGANNSGLSNDIEKFKTFINETSKWFVPKNAIENDGTEHIRLYNYRMNDFLIWLDEIK